MDSVFHSVTKGLTFPCSSKALDDRVVLDSDATSTYSTKYNRYGTAPFVNNTQLLKAYADSHWSEDNRDIYALYPRYSAYENLNNTATSTWWMRDGSFLRLKQLELGYTIPQKLTTKLHIGSLRVYFQGNNLLCWSKFKLWDPELAGNGLNYPTSEDIQLWCECYV